MMGGPFGYHNPTLTASPFSTLPRRIGTLEGTRPQVSLKKSLLSKLNFNENLNQIQYPSPNKLNGPIMELTEVTSSFGGGFRAASLGRGSSLVKQMNTSAVGPDPNNLVRHKLL